MNEYDKYAGFDIADLVVDDYFFNWVKHPDGQSDQFWHTFLLLYPQKERVVNESRAFILSVDWEDSFTHAAKKDLWEDIRRAMGQQAPVVEIIARRRFIYRGIAAACTTGILMLSASLLYFYYFNGNKMIHSAYGQKRAVILPDGSSVTLNGNSTIRYARNFKSDESREVWVQGEAFFDVKHISLDPDHARNGKPFIVHTASMNIEVLGTQFDVNTRRGDAGVSLNTGKIRISFKDRRDTLTLQPGELVNYSRKTKLYVRKAIDPYSYSSWIDNKLVLDNTPFSAIRQLLDDNYGYTILLSDTSILNEKLSGEIPTSQEDEMIRALSRALNINISRQQNNTLVITRSN